MHSLNNNSNNSSDSESDLIKLRVQYVADTDPFTCLSMFPIPTRPVQYSFLLVTPLMHQMNTLIKVLNAPQRVSEDFILKKGGLKVIDFVITLVFL